TSYLHDALPISLNASCAGRSVCTPPRRRHGDRRRQSRPSVHPAWPGSGWLNPARYRGRRRPASVVLAPVEGFQLVSFNPLVLAQIAHQIIAATVGGQYGAGATLADGAQQSRPVGVIAQLETMVITAPAAVASNAHPAGGKTGAGIAK